MPKTYTELTLKDLVALAEVKLRKSPTTSASFPKCLHVYSPRITLLHLLPLAPPSRNPAITQEKTNICKTARRRLLDTGQPSDKLRTKGSLILHSGDAPR